MASTIKVDKLDPQSGTALEIGTSGDTITVPSGVTLTTTNATVNLPASVGGLGTGITNAQLAGSIDVTSKITGVVPAANLGTGTASSSTVLYGDGTFKTEPGGMHTLISTTTLSDDASVSITGMDSTYSRYLITFNNLKSASDDVAVYLQLIIGGSIQTGGNYAYGNNTRNSASGADGNESGSAGSFKFSKSGIGNATGENFSGELIVYNPSETSQFKNFAWRSVYQTASGTIDSNVGGGFYNSGQAAVTGVAISMSGGNLTSGIVKLYGIV